MKFLRINNVWIFTVCVLNRVRVFAEFRSGIGWAFTQKLAAACAADMERS